jgi:four helix bundle protein
MTSSYRDLKVWQRSIDLAENIYRLTAAFPSTEMYGLTSQMRRAAVSIASNRAEGWGRNSRKDYSRFVLVARGSNDELLTQLVIAERLGLGGQEKLAEATALSGEIGRMLTGLHGFLQKPRSTALVDPPSS